MLVGFVRRTAESPDSTTLADTAFGKPLREVPDRLSRGEWFLKRKFASTGHAKNFLAGSLANPADWFDELAGRVNFPDLLAPALLSCALLEQAQASGHDFFHAPMVYGAHRIGVHAPAARALRSNEPLHLLVTTPVPVAGTGGGTGGAVAQSGAGVCGAGGSLAGPGGGGSGAACGIAGSGGLTLCKGIDDAYPGNRGAGLQVFRQQHHTGGFASGLDDHRVPE